MVSSIGHIKPGIPGCVHAYPPCTHEAECIQKEIDALAQYDAGQIDLAVRRIRPADRKA